MEDNTNKVVEPTENIDYKAEYEKLVNERDNYKALKDKYSKESADWKNKYTSTLSDVELAKTKQEEKDAYTKTLEEKIARIEMGAELSKSISDEKVLNAVLDNFVEGRNVEAIKKINAYIDTKVANAIKEREAELLKSNPVPPPVSATGGLTQEQFDAMTYAEKSALYLKDKATYDKFTK